MPNHRTQVPPAPPEDPPSTPPESGGSKALDPSVSEHGNNAYPYAEKGRIVDGERRPHPGRWKHAAAAALHNWAEYAHHNADEKRLSADDYSKAIEAACEPKSGKYVPHGPAHFDQRAASKAKG